MITWDEIDLVPTGNERAGAPLFRLSKPVRYYLNGALITKVGTDFETDKTSFPRPMRKWFSWVPLFQKWFRDDAGKYAPGALLHDHLLDMTPMPQWQVDWLYAGALRASGVSALEAWIFSTAVRFKRIKR